MIGLIWITLIFLACSGSGGPKPCSSEDAVMIAKAAECRARVNTECADLLDSACPVIAECDKWAEDRCGVTK